MANITGWLILVGVFILFYVSTTRADFVIYFCVLSVVFAALFSPGFRQFFTRPPEIYNIRNPNWEDRVAKKGSKCLHRQNCNCHTAYHALNQEYETIAATLDRRTRRLAHQEEKVAKLQETLRHCKDDRAKEVAGSNARDANLKRISDLQRQVERLERENRRLEDQWIDVQAEELPRLREIEKLYETSARDRFDEHSRELERQLEQARMENSIYKKDFNSLISRIKDRARSNRIPIDMKETPKMTDLEYVIDEWHRLGQLHIMAKRETDTVAQLDQLADDALSEILERRPRRYTAREFFEMAIPQLKAYKAKLGELVGREQARDASIKLLQVQIRTRDEQLQISKDRLGGSKALALESEFSFKDRTSIFHRRGPLQASINELTYLIDLHGASPPPVGPIETAPVNTSSPDDWVLSLCRIDAFIQFARLQQLVAFIQTKHHWPGSQLDWEPSNTVELSRQREDHSINERAQQLFNGMKRAAEAIDQASDKTPANNTNASVVALASIEDVERNNTLRGKAKHLWTKLNQHNLAGAILIPNHIDDRADYRGKAPVLKYAADNKFLAEAIKNMRSIERNQSGYNAESGNEFDEPRRQKHQGGGYRGIFYTDHDDSMHHPPNDYSTGGGGRRGGAARRDGGTQIGNARVGGRGERQGRGGHIENDISQTERGQAAKNDDGRGDNNNNPVQRERVGQTDNNTFQGGRGRRANHKEGNENTRNKGNHDKKEERKSGDRGDRGREKNDRGSRRDNHNKYTPPPQPEHENREKDGRERQHDEIL